VKILTLWCFAPRVRKQSLRSECHIIISSLRAKRGNLVFCPSPPRGPRSSLPMNPSLRAKRGNLVFVRILFILCHPEVIPKDLLVEDCQVKILRCTQNDKTFFSHCERSAAIWCSSVFFSSFVILRLYRRIF
jgi:hypothetical protein